MTTTKAFKSGNSTAVRLPKSFGVEPGTRLILREEQGQFVIEPVRLATDKIDVWSFYGSCPGIDPVIDRGFDPRPSERDEAAA
jgi:antitoxin VapB